MVILKHYYYSIKRLHPEIYDHKDRYLEFYKTIVENQINLIIEWQRVGFIHGVMNTDNMALSGETIDYGPCAFLDEYNQKRFSVQLIKMEDMHLTISLK